MSEKEQNTSYQETSKVLKSASSSPSHIFKIQNHSEEDVFDSNISELNLNVQEHNFSSNLQESSPLTSTRLSEIDVSKGSAKINEYAVLRRKIKV